MKKVKKVGITLLVIFVFLALGIYAYSRYLMPKNEGKIAIKGISKNTTVYFDEYGIPHIYGATERDAMIVLGYVHAQDRLWQMELMRRIAPGRLAELFGTKALKSDKLFAGIGIEETSQKIVDELDKNSEVYKLSMAYLEGLNQFLENGTTPLEYELVGVKKEKFTLKDICNIYGFMSFSFAVGQKSDPMMTDIKLKLGDKYLKDFGLDGEFSTTRIKNFEGKAKEYNEVSKTIASLFTTMPVAPFLGSNSWVIGGEKTKSGKVIFANDPHITFSQPCTWYEAHLDSPNHEMYGYYIAGTPFPLLGHNHQYAYGLTMFINDDVDMFEEELNPANNQEYKYGSDFKKFEIIKKTIKVKDSSDVVLTIKKSIHGPVIDELLGLKDRKNLAMYWIYTQQKNDILKAVHALSHAKNVTDFYKNTAQLAAPGLNIMYGDALGNIGWKAVGKLYKQDKSVNPNFVLNGANTIDDKKEFLDFSQNPSALNPTWNYVYSANNQPQAVNNFLYPGYYAPNNRADRIVSFLDSKNNWTKEDVAKMINDDTSVVEVKNTQTILSNLNDINLNKNEKEAFAFLNKWNGNNATNAIAPTIYNKIMFRIYENTFKDEMGKDIFETFIGSQVMKRMIEPLVANDKSIWWDNIQSKNGIETRKQIFETSFHEAIVALEKQLGKDMTKWTWGSVHTLEHQHALGKVAALRSYFNVGPFSVPGTGEVINNLKFNYTNDGLYKVTAGPSTRRIIDFSDVENSISIIPTGQSGVQTSPHYSDQAAMYNAGKFRKMKLNKKEIIATSTKLTFVPIK
jgi:penicillin amidase